MIEKAILSGGQQIVLSGSGSVVKEGMVVCPDCGFELAPGSKFCPNCGKKL